MKGNALEKRGKTNSSNPSSNPSNLSCLVLGNTAYILTQRSNDDRAEFPPVPRKGLTPYLKKGKKYLNP